MIASATARGDRSDVRAVIEILDSSPSGWCDPVSGACVIPDPAGGANAPSADQQGGGRDNDHEQER